MGDDEKQVLFNNQKQESNSHSHGKDDGLMSFRSCLRWMCVDQSNPWWASLSWLLFFLLAIIVPTVSHFWLACADCDAKLHRPYDAVLQLSLTSIATVSFLCLSKFVRKYGLRRFLYLDKLCDESEKVRQGYTAQLHRSLKILAFFVLPCFALEAAYKIWWYSSGASQIPFLGNVYLSDAIACILELSSWLYRTSVFFLVCVLFRLICYLQILRLQDFAQVFQEESDVASVLKEHLRIRRHLRVISHRYRAFILSALIIITASQFASLFNTTRFHDVSLYRTGELASSSLPISKTFVLRKKWLCSYHPRMLCSLTMMAGLFILLRGATKITHKAQSITCLAAKWHICATLDSFDGTDSETPMTQIISHERLFSMNLGGESDDDDAGDEDDDINTTKFFMPAFAHTISFQKRQALVTYFENNRAGITVFGFMLDRTYMHTIFGIELSLVLWLLGKTIGIS